MNRKQYNELNGISGTILELREKLEEIAGKIEDRYDVLSDKMQESDKGQKLYEAYNALNDAVSYLESAEECIDDATNVYSEDFE